MSAYSELYLDDAMCTMGEMCDYAIHDCGLDADLFYDVFCASPVCRQFEKGNPKYVSGRSGFELARDVWKQMTGEALLNPPAFSLDRSPEYWAGWSLAYYQWFRDQSFRKMKIRGLGISETISMYILHEADISKFVMAADGVISIHQKKEESMLRRLRKYYGMTQKLLSEQSGVSLRMIQLYEQGQNDLSKAQAHVVQALANTLNCSVDDLIERHRQ